MLLPDGIHEFERESQPSPVSALLPIPPLDEPVSVPMSGWAVRNFTLSREDVREVPCLARVLEDP